MKGAASDTGTLPVSIIAGPAAGSVAEKVWEAGNGHARVGLLTPSSPTLAGPNVSLRLFRLASADPKEISDQIRTIAEQQQLDHLIIQCDKAQPLMAYASLFAMENEELTSSVRLTQAAISITPGGILDLLLPNRANPAQGPVCFIVEQLEFADKIVFDSDANDRDLDLARTIVAALNPRAALLTSPAEYAGDLLKADDGPAFDFGAALDAAEWRRLIEEQTHPVSYPNRVTSMAYHARKPFHPERLWHVLEHDLRNVFRAKGFLWLATRTDFVGGLNLAGSELQCAAAGQWWATRDTDTRAREMPVRTREQWQEPFGDRRQAIALMSINVEPSALRSQLDACLLTAEEMTSGPELWQHLPDPFPSWSAHAHHHDCDHDHGSEPHDCCHHH